MINVGLVGEDPNDTSSINNLLSKQYGSGIKFLNLVRGIRGTQLETIKFRNALKIELEKKQGEFVLFIRDLDAFSSQGNEVEKRKAWFKLSSEHCGGKHHLFLLNIWELEALIFGDIDCFNSAYGTSIKPGRNPMQIRNPKEELQNATFKSKKRFEASHCPDIFSKLDLNEIKSNCQNFKEFLNQFDNLLLKEYKLKFS
ncbi:protein of unknown function [Pedobacter steynii]|uniref:DUF4276 family protein n=1 Tax=Pedobacter steynii TaxID=430522 RepID=A0A1G9IY67_9SPHI|nr:DUF4276 family protein [Pedobacter steynii]NQX38084.1 DUF4276 family protein [Pedobacter steynii]SDL30160.1 protein of unknown function [Pedobacter steynii]